MPKTRRHPHEVEAVRERILEQAVELIAQDGFEGFSMRKLGRRLGTAAKTIYNYFSNRDELYLMVLTRGFEDLIASCRAARDATNETTDRVLAVLRAYVAFGRTRPRQYEVMFTRSFPKFADYVGTPVEEAARRQNETALGLATLALAVISEEAEGAPDISAEESLARLFRLWAVAHGVVSLLNSRVTLEVGDFEGMVERILDEVVRT